MNKYIRMSLKAVVWLNQSFPSILIKGLSVVLSQYLQSLNGLLYHKETHFGRVAVILVIYMIDVEHFVQTISVIQGYSALW